MAKDIFISSSGCLGRAEIVFGDARLALDRDQTPQNFDVLVLDAFSGDAIPVHLLTAEAFAIYLRRLAPEGVIAVHISNRHFALRPVIEAAADRYQLKTAAIDTPPGFDGRNKGTKSVGVSPAVGSSRPLRKSKNPPMDAPCRRSADSVTDDHVSLADVSSESALTRRAQEGRKRESDPLRNAAQRPQNV